MHDSQHFFANLRKIEFEQNLNKFWILSQNFESKKIFESNQKLNLNNFQIRGKINFENNLSSNKFKIWAKFKFKQFPNLGKFLIRMIFKNQTKTEQKDQKPHKTRL
jgi:hypothetical protein